MVASAPWEEPCAGPGRGDWIRKVDGKTCPRQPGDPACPCMQCFLQHPPVLWGALWEWGRRSPEVVPLRSTARAYLAEEWKALGWPLGESLLRTSFVHVYVSRVYICVYICEPDVLESPWPQPPLYSDANLPQTLLPSFDKTH